MTLDSIQNIYQDRYIRLANNGESVANAISKLTHRYLDGKPGKVGKHILRAADRDIDFWSADFWLDASVEVFETEEFMASFPFLSALIRQR